MPVQVPVPVTTVPEPAPHPTSPLAHCYSPVQDPIPLVHTQPLGNVRRDLSPALHRAEARDRIIHQHSEARNIARAEIDQRMAAIRDGVIDHNLAEVGGSPVPVNNQPFPLPGEATIPEMEADLGVMREEEYRLKSELDRVQSDIARIERALGRHGRGPSLPPHEPQRILGPQPAGPGLYAPAPITGEAANAALNYAVPTAREWVAVLDPTRNRHYYWNPATHETTWVLPPDAVVRPK